MGDTPHVGTRRRHAGRNLGIDPLLYSKIMGDFMLAHNNMNKDKNDVALVSFQILELTPTSIPKFCKSCQGSTDLARAARGRFGIGPHPNSKKPGDFLLDHRQLYVLVYRSLRRALEHQVQFMELWWGSIPGINTGIQLCNHCYCYNN